MSEGRVLYRQLLRAGKSFNDYNFRNYILRRVREEFRKSIGETDPDKQRALLEEGKKSVGIVQRQATLSQLYNHQKSMFP